MSGEDLEYVKGYTKKDGTKVDGFYRTRKKSSGGESPAASAAAMDTFGTQVGDRFERDGKTYEAVRITPAGSGGRGAASGPVVHLKAVVDGKVQPAGHGVTHDVHTTSMSHPAAAYARATASDQDKVNAGLAALRAQRASTGSNEAKIRLAEQALASHRATLSSAADKDQVRRAIRATEAKLSELRAGAGENRCGTCGQFAGKHHTCRAPEGTVIDERAKAAAQPHVDLHQDITVTEYVPHSGKTSFSVTGPHGTWLITPRATPASPDGYEVAKSDSIIVQQMPNLDQAMSAASLRATDNPAGVDLRQGDHTIAARTADGNTVVIAQVSHTDGRDRCPRCGQYASTDHVCDGKASAEDIRASLAETAGYDRLEDLDDEDQAEIVSDMQQLLESEPRATIEDAYVFTLLAPGEGWEDATGSPATPAWVAERLGHDVPEPSEPSSIGEPPDKCPACGQFMAKGHWCEQSTGEEFNPKATYICVERQAGMSPFVGETEAQDVVLGPYPDAASAHWALEHSVELEGILQEGGVDCYTFDPDSEEGPGLLADAEIVEPSELGPETPARESRRCDECGQYTSLEGHTCFRNLDAKQGKDGGSSERAKAMLAELEASVQHIVESGQLTRYLDAMAANGMNRWSFNNQMLVLMQAAGRRMEGHEDDPDFNPFAEPIHAMTFNQWKEQGRSVTKGAKACHILTPVKIWVNETDKDGKPILDAEGKPKRKQIANRFSTKAVFLAEDTEGEPIPNLDKPKTAGGAATPGTIAGLKDRVAAAGFEYSESPNTGGARGYTTADGSKKVVLNSGLTDEQAQSTLAHELGHIHCGHIENHSEYRQHRGRFETEAEMTSYLVARSRGWDVHQSTSFSAGYIAAWTKGDTKILQKAMSTATKASQKILEGDWPDK